METCKAFDPVFEVACTLPAGETPHDRHVNDDDSGWSVSWKNDPEETLYQHFTAE